MHALTGTHSTHTRARAHAHTHTYTHARVRALTQTTDIVIYQNITEFVSTGKQGGNEIGVVFSNMLGSLASFRIDFSK